MTASKIREMKRKLVRIKRRELTRLTFTDYDEKPGSEYLTHGMWTIFLWPPTERVGDQYGWSIFKTGDDKPTAFGKSGNKWHARAEAKKKLAEILVVEEIMEFGKKKTTRTELKEMAHEEDSHGAPEGDGGDDPQ